MRGGKKVPAALVISAKEKTGRRTMCAGKWKGRNPDENRLERVPNVSNYEIYISRLDEMLDRKEKNIFMEVEKGC